MGDIGPSCVSHVTVAPSPWRAPTLGARHSASSVLLNPASASYFVMGGIQETDACGDAWVIHASSGELEQVAVKDLSMFQHAACLTPDGRVVQYGGRQGARMSSGIATVRLPTGRRNGSATPILATFTKLADEPVPRSDHTITLTLDDEVIVYGGYGGHGTYFKDVYQLEPDTGKAPSVPAWSKVTARGGKKRAGHSAVVLHSGPYTGAILVFGGYNKDEYFNGVDMLQHQDSDKWVWLGVEAEGSLPAARGCHSANMTADANMLIWGGAGPESVLLNDLHVLNTWTMTWSTPEVTGVLPAPRYAHCAFLVSTGLVILGGTGHQERFGEAEMLVLDPEGVHPCDKCGKPSANSYRCAACEGEHGPISCLPGYSSLGYSPATPSGGGSAGEGGVSSELVSLLCDQCRATVDRLQQELRRL
eukprot:TRINITY_DN4067_c0_g3_i2.p1 TRINITY_DN4067_c0_g3~~TRINITY_DN4067_c0_g3_i2.p1  ORF type:complete len:419 (+),score=53.36 TRINITY_DN4067_c0_g3_i2:104-1360(+)